MSKECDIFSDTYGCVFTDCEGYQAPFPILRLGDASRRDQDDLQAIAHSRTVPVAPRLLSLRLGAASSPYRSFLEILSPQTLPVSIQWRGVSNAAVSVRYLSRPSKSHRVTAVVSRTTLAAGPWAANFIARSSDSSAAAWQCIVPGVHAVAMVDDNLAWCLHGGANSAATVDPEALVTSVASLSSQPQPVAVRAPATQGIGHIAATDHDAAVLFHTRGAVGLDRRDSAAAGSWALALPPGSRLLPSASCGVAGDSLLVCCTAEGRLLLYDQRKVGAPSADVTPLLDKCLGTFASVRSWRGRDELLLVAADQVGVFDTRSLTAIGALQQSSDGDVLDATLLPSSSELHRLCICTSALNGMLYCWRMAR